MYIKLIGHAMRKLFSFLTIVAVVFSLGFVQVAEARKFGASKSFGRSFKTAPAQPSPAMNTSTLNKQTQPQANGRGLMGGLLGGLVAGGLFAWLLGSGAFDGIQIFDILLLAGVAFLLFKLFAAKKSQTQRQEQQPAFGGASFRSAPIPEETQTASASFTQAANDVPFNLPNGFDIPGFVKGACDHYRLLQEAWNLNDFNKIQEYVSPELYNDLKAERANYPGDQHTEVLYVNAEIVRADQTRTKAELSLLFKGRYRDNVERVEENIDEIWHLERDLTQANAPWLIVGIENK